MISAPRSSPACVLASQYNNPQETYNYYYLPFCAPPGAEKAKHKWGGLGEVLEGNELIDSQLEVKFRSAPRQPLKAAWPCCALKIQVALRPYESGSLSAAQHVFRVEQPLAHAVCQLVVSERNAGHVCSMSMAARRSMPVEAAFEAVAVSVLSPFQHLVSSCNAQRTCRRRPSARCRSTRRR